MMNADESLLVSPRLFRYIGIFFFVCYYVYLSSVVYMGMAGVHCLSRERERTAAAKLCRTRTYVV
jgi:hypothetical protein